MEFDQSKLYQQFLFNKVHSQAIQQNEEHIKMWTQYRDRHKQIIEGLKTLSLDLSMNCIVPLGKRALMKGKLKHTSEILVCIGDGYFVKYTTQQAIALCNRRIKCSEDILDKFEKERNLLETRQMLPLHYGAFELGDCENVIEHWDEKKLDDWRVEHKKREQEYRQKLSYLKNKKKEEVVTESDLFRRLDELELEEELADELNRLEDEHQKLCGNSLQINKKYDESDEESDEESNVESEEEPNEESDEESNEESDEEVGEAENGINIDHVPKKKRKQIIDEENLLIKSSADIKHNKQEISSVKVSTEQTNKEFQTQSEQNIEIIPNKDNKVNGKFEVSIIKEDDVEKVLEIPNISMESSLTFCKSEEQKFKKNELVLQENTVCLEEDYNFEKLKSSSRRVSFAEPRFFELESDLNEIDKDNNENNVTDENEYDNTIEINFLHSEVTPLSSNTNTNSNITSPGDIYTLFYKPKSILKKSLDSEYNSKNISLDNYSIQEESDESIGSDNIINSTYNIVVHDVQDRSIEKVVTQCNESINKNRPISRFKLERDNLKKGFK